MGEWYLHMFGITLAGDWWPITILPILFGPGGCCLLPNCFVFLSNPML